MSDGNTWHGVEFKRGYVPAITSQCNLSFTLACFQFITVFARL